MRPLLAQSSLLRTTAQLRHFSLLIFAFCLLIFLCAAQPLSAADQPLQLSVYATAGGVNRYLATPQGREAALTRLRSLGISKIFLEGRRGDEYVPPETLRALRDFFTQQGFRTVGGIATVPGKQFGVRQNEKLSWLNWQAAKTQRDITQFFTENAPIFDELIVDDFYCTADTSPESEKARGGRSWSQYRQDLLVSLAQPMMIRPARAARPSIRLIVKYPQWYDRFHLFGYDPLRLSAFFDQVWVGTEVRNPLTQRMGFVQPTEGYMNFRWLSAVAGQKVQGAWFDHIECTAQNFVDQAYQSVLAGARELTLFQLGDLMEGHPGHALLASALPELLQLAERVRGRTPQGIAFYKPPGSASDENLYLMDYLGMIGLPVVPAARYPAEARVAILGVQAAADPRLLGQMRSHLRRGATLILTPALVRRVGPPLAKMAGVTVSAQAEPAVTTDTALEIDLGLKASSAQTRLTAQAADRQVPLLTANGKLLVWNVRTFSEQDYRDTGEWLLAPKPRGLPAMPQPLADALRDVFLAPLAIRLSAPTQVAFYLFKDTRCFYNFRNHPVELRLNENSLQVPANALACQQ